MDSPAINNAILSVSDKTGLVPLASRLAAAGVAIYSTGGTRAHLEAAGLPVRDIASYTGFPEMMDGRIKTLHPKVHGGLLCRRELDHHVSALEEHQIVPFDLVVVNLYPFEQTIARSDATVSEAIEQIDIGGPSVIRSAAKNHQFVTVATDPAQYDRILEQIASDGRTTLALRREYAQAAFAQTARYDAAIAAYFAKTLSDAPLPDAPAADASFPERVTLSLARRSSLRYGENPHQQAALYATDRGPAGSLVAAEQLHGKELSYNNLLDLDAALAAALSLPRPGVAVLKHNNPCGAATAATLGEAAAMAWAGDPLSAFGSVLGVNVPVDAEMAEFLAEPGKFVEAIIAPDFSPAALDILTTRPKWKANVRLLRTGARDAPAGLRWRHIDGGWLCQTADDQPDQPDAWQTVTEARPSADQQADLEFAWAACRHVKSNAIVLARQQALVGVGAGQMSRVDAVEIALRKAAQRSRGAVLASDAFFPFDDSIEAAARAGVSAVIQPGGSRRDQEVIAACNRHGLPMIFTGARHFRH